MAQTPFLTAAIDQILKDPKVSLPQPQFTQLMSEAAKNHPIGAIDFLKTRETIQRSVDAMGSVKIDWKALEKQVKPPGEILVGIRANMNQLRDSFAKVNQELEKMAFFGAIPRKED